MVSIPASVLIQAHIMVGVDIEKNCFPPPVGPSPPFLPYAVFSALGYGLAFTKPAKKTICQNVKPMQQDTDIGFFIPHVGVYTNMLLPLTFFSKSKSVFGVSSVLLESKPIAAACLPPNSQINLNCSSPISSPTGYVFATNTVMAGMTLGDFLAGIASMAFSMALDLVFKFLNDWVAGKILPDLFKKMFTQAILTEGETFLGKVYTFLGSEFGEFYQKVVGDYVKKIFKTLETLGMKGLKPVFDPDGGIRKPVRDAGNDYLNSPDIAAVN